MVCILNHFRLRDSILYKKRMIKVNDSDKRFPISNTNKADKPLCEKDDRIKCFIRLLEEKGFIVKKEVYSI